MEFSPSWIFLALHLRLFRLCPCRQPGQCYFWDGLHSWPHVLVHSSSHSSYPGLLWWVWSQQLFFKHIDPYWSYWRNQWVHHGKCYPLIFYLRIPCLSCPTVNYMSYADEKRGIGHGLEPTSHDCIGMSKGDRLMPQGNRFKSRWADFVDGSTGNTGGNTSLDGCLSGRCLS